MNNIKDFLYESILDNVDSKINNSVELDDVADNVLLNKVIGALGLNRPRYNAIRYTYDKKTKVIKIDPKSGYFMHLFVDNGKICVFNGSYVAKLDELVNAGVKFDCDLQVDVECITCGLRLSHCNIVGKKHILKLADGGMGVKSIDINSLVDMPTSCFDTVMMPLGVVDVQRCLNTLSRFKYCIFTNNGYNITNTWQEELSKITSLKCDVIYVRDMSSNFGLEGSRFSLALKREKRLHSICKKLIESNPDAKVLVGIGRDDVTLVWMDDDKLEYKEIVKTSRTANAAPWRKVK